MSVRSVRTQYVMMSYYHRWATRRILAHLTKMNDNSLSTPPLVFPQTNKFTNPVLKNVNLPCGSMYGTLCHLYFAETLWYRRLKGEEISDRLNALWTSDDPHNWANEFNKFQGVPDFTSPNTTETELAEAERKYASRLLNGLSFALDDINSDWLEFTKGTEENTYLSPVVYTDTTGLERKRNMTYLLQHMFNHATHHRGQLSAVITMHGGETPALDITEFLPEWEELHAKAFRWA